MQEVAYRRRHTLAWLRHTSSRQPKLMYGRVPYSVTGCLTRATIKNLDSAILGTHSLAEPKFGLVLVHKTHDSEGSCASLHELKS